jgi:hypothetical protein
MMTHHILKIGKEFMQAKIAGDKLFEVRLNDRGFQKGDTVAYITDDHLGTPYGGLYEITYVINYNQKENWVVYGERMKR